MKSAIVIFTVLLLSACASAPIEKNIRKANYKFANPSSKDAAFDGVQLFFAKNFTTTKVMKIKNRKTGLIAGDIILECSIFNQAGDGNEYELQTFYTVNVRKNDVSLIFEDVRYINASWAYLKITDKAKMAQVKSKCLDPLANEIKASL